MIEWNKLFKVLMFCYEKIFKLKWNNKKLELEIIISVIIVFANEIFLRVYAVAKCTR